MSGDGGTPNIKESTLIVDVKDNRQVKARSVISELEKTYGVGSILAVVPRSGNLFEITVSEKQFVNDLSHSGFSVEGQKYDCHAIYSAERLVSFMHLPAFIEDDVILQKLAVLGVEVLSPVKKKNHPGTNVADGTRYVICKFPPNINSLPYTMRFQIDKDKYEYVRVKHDKQAKVCSQCLSDEHLYAECPDNQCYRCNNMGHLARNCEVPPCPNCKNFPSKCRCEQHYHTGWTPAAENIDDGVSDNESTVRREFFRINKERKRKQENREQAPRESKQEKVDEANNDGNEGEDFELQSDKNEGEHVSDVKGADAKNEKVERDTAVFPKFRDDIVEVEVDDGTFKSMVEQAEVDTNNDCKISNSDINDELLNLPLNKGPFSTSEMTESDSCAGPTDSSRTGLESAEAGDSVEGEHEEDLSSETEMEAEESKSSQGVVHKPNNRTKRRRRLVNKPKFTPEGLQKLKLKTKK